MSVSSSSIDRAASSPRRSRIVPRTYDGAAAANELTRNRATTTGGDAYGSHRPSRSNALRRSQRAMRRALHAQQPGAAACEGQRRRPVSTHALLSRRSGLTQFATCVLCSQLIPPPARSEEAFEYSRAAVWPGACQSGAGQSPLSLDTAAESSSTAQAAPLAFRYSPSACRALRTTHGVQLNFAAGAQQATLGGREAELLQFHFHSPSEHALGGERQAMEAHLVHRVESGGLAVVATLLQASSGAPSNAALALALRSAPAVGEEAAVGALVQPSQLLPPAGRRSHFRYTGSLTTPPCSEGVEWFVMATPLAVPAGQVLAFQQLVGQHALALNARPLQPPNGRSIRLVRA